MKSTKSIGLMAIVISVILICTGCADRYYPAASIWYKEKGYAMGVLLDKGKPQNMFFLAADDMQLFGSQTDGTVVALFDGARCYYSDSGLSLKSTDESDVKKWLQKTDFSYMNGLKSFEHEESQCFVAYYEDDDGIICTAVVLQDSHAGAKNYLLIDMALNENLHEEDVLEYVSRYMHNDEVDIYSLS